MADFGVGAENNRRKSQHCSRIMGLCACVNYGCSRDCNRGNDGDGGCGVFWSSWCEFSFGHVTIMTLPFGA